jgi:hypothetical protein
MLKKFIYNLKNNCPRWAKFIKKRSMLDKMGVFLIKSYKNLKKMAKIVLLSSTICAKLYLVEH